MDFTFTEEQETIAKVARQLFEDRATPEHLTELEAGDVRYDAALWRDLATADLLGIALPERFGGTGNGFLELALLLAEVGWSVAPVPVYATLLLGADTIARHGDEGQRRRYLPDVVNGGRLLTAGLAEPRRSDPTVPAMHARALVGLCAIQLGVTERALRIAAAYTSEREQFGRPIGSFQAVQQRMAYAFIDVEAIRWTMWRAAWLLGQGTRASREAGIAKFWAGEAGARVAAIAQQVHGGIGIDTTYPLFRYFLWAKHNELTLGSASAQLARLGAAY
jgi:alkylation response protein AidB-like acyl-CoA dehydrogenase